MGIDAWAALLFVALLGLFLYRKRKYLELKKIIFPVLYIIMYRSGFGLRTMDLWARKARSFFRFLGYVGIVAGFLGMVFIAFELVLTTFNIFQDPSSAGVQLVLPFEAKGTLFVPFLYWIISIFVVAVVHEFAHGVVARCHKIPLKSTGFAFFSLFVPILPAAFVEPDETTLTHRPAREQLSVYAAGPFANILFAGVFFSVLLALAPVADAMFEPDGVEIVSLVPGGAAEVAGVEQGMVIAELNDMDVDSVDNLTSAIRSQPPDEKVVVETDDNRRFVFDPDIDPANESLPVIGVSVKPHARVKMEYLKDNPAWLPPVVKWFSGLFLWLFLLNFGIGLFNLLPVGPLDGGHMSRVALQSLISDKKKALKVWGYLSLFFIGLILMNIFAGFFI